MDLHPKMKKKKTVALTRNILGNSLILLNTSICIICKSDDEGHLTGWIIIKQKKKAYWTISSVIELPIILHLVRVYYAAIGYS